MLVVWPCQPRRLCVLRRGKELYWKDEETGFASSFSAQSNAKGAMDATAWVQPGRFTCLAG